MIYVQSTLNCIIYFDFLFDFSKKLLYLIWFVYNNE